VKEDRVDGSRPAAARHLKLLGASATKDVEESVFRFGAQPEKNSQKSMSEKPKLSPKKLIPASRLISRLPVLTQTRRSGKTGFYEHHYKFERCHLRPYVFHLSSAAEGQRRHNAVNGREA